MERHKQIAYQLDLSAEEGINAFAHTPISQGVPDDLEVVGSQVTCAGEQERALTEQVKELVETAVIRKFVRWCERTVVKVASYSINRRCSLRNRGKVNKTTQQPQSG